MKKIKLEVEMEDRWVPVFLSFLRTMEANGNTGHSEILAIFDDGDGDFRPKFHNVLVVAEGILQTADEGNRNGRIYPNIDGRHINFQYDIVPNTYHSYCEDS